MKETTASDNNKSWAIIGGGILGMRLADKIKTSSNAVSVFESYTNLGGLLSSTRLGEVSWDSFYHVILKSDTKLLSLLEEIGLKDQIEWNTTKTGFYSSGKFYSMSNVIEYLKFPLISLWSKLRLGFTILYASKIKAWEKLEQIPVDKWLKKISGEATYKKLWQPLLRAKLGENYKEVSASFIWATIQRMYAARRSGLKTEMFGYLPGGYSNILKTYQHYLVDKGLDIKTNHQLKTLEVLPDGRILLKFKNGKRYVYDKVIITFPSIFIPRVCNNLPLQEKKMHRSIKYMGVICVSLLLKKPLTDYYITNIVDPGYPFTGVIEMSSLVNPEHFKGHTLVYLPKYVLAKDDYFMMPEEEIFEEFVNGLMKMHPGLSKSDIIDIKLSKARYVFALPVVDYSKKIPPVQSSLPNLYLLNSAHIVNGTLNVNETLNLAESSINKLFN